jgi:hypothetical protein
LCQINQMTHIQLFLELAKPNSEGISEIIYATQFVGKYSVLKSGNGYKWPEALQGQYTFLRGGRGANWFIRLTGFCNKNSTRSIRRDIIEKISGLSCEHTGFYNLSSDKIEIDHRNGRYNDASVLNLETQKVEDFMALTRRSNLQKREDCKACKSSGKRFDAKKLGYRVGWSEGGENYDGNTLGCLGCYWYGPIDFRSKLIISQN